MFLERLVMSGKHIHQQEGILWFSIESCPGLCFTDDGVAHLDAACGWVRDWDTRPSRPAAYRALLEGEGCSVMAPWCLCDQRFQNCLLIMLCASYILLFSFTGNHCYGAAADVGEVSGPQGCRWVMSVMTGLSSSCSLFLLHLFFLFLSLSFSLSFSLFLSLSFSLALSFFFLFIIFL